MPELSPIYRLDRAADPAIVDLDKLDAYFDGRQHDHLGVDWWGDHIPGSTRYLALRQHWSTKGLTPSAKLERSIVARRPCAQMGLAREVNDTFTEAVIPEMPQVVVIGDKAATECLGELLKASLAGLALSELRSKAGRSGGAAMLVDVVGGDIILTVWPGPAVHVETWARPELWIPGDVVYQRTVTVSVRDGGKVKAAERVRTTRYTEEFVVEYEDVPCDWPQDEPIPERSRRPHYLGRCPVIWHQNTRSSDSPYGAHDLETEANLELCDRADQMFSANITGSAANVEPTVWKADSLTGQSIYPRVQKGTGKLIQLTENGKVGFLEITGATLEAGWATLDRIVERVERNTRCVLPRTSVRKSGSQKTATEIETSMTSMVNKVSKLRQAMAPTIEQLCVLLLVAAREFGVTWPGSSAPGIVLPPKMVEPEDVASEPDVESDVGEDDAEEKQEDDAEEEMIPVAFDPGAGEAISIRWPLQRRLTPAELPGALSALQTASGGKQVLSRETAIAEAVSALGRTDPDAECERIKHDEHEEEERQAEIFTPPNVAMEDAVGAAAASEPAEDGGTTGDGPGAEEGGDTQTGGQPPQEEE